MKTKQEIFARLCEIDNRLSEMHSQRYSCSPNPNERTQLSQEWVFLSRQYEKA